jgi:hypothetical protein
LTSTNGASVGFSTRRDDPSGNYRDLVIYLSGADGKIVSFGQNIADVTQKPLVVAQIKWLARALTRINSAV